MSRARDVAFEEVQPLRQPRLLITLAVPPAVMALAAIWQAGFGHPLGQHPISNGALIGWTVFLWLVYWRLVSVKLVTRVDGGEVSVKMRGIWRARRVPRDQIASAAVLSFDPMRDFGGRGIRSIRNGKAYIAQGNRGVRLQLTTGEAVVIGSARPEELKSALGIAASTP